MPALLKVQTGIKMSMISEARLQEIVNGTFELCDWFREQGIDKPEPMMRILAAVVVSDEPLTEAEIQRTRELFPHLFGPVCP